MYHAYLCIVSYPDLICMRKSVDTKLGPEVLLVLYDPTHTRAKLFFSG